VEANAMGSGQGQGRARHGLTGEVWPWKGE
jgi:hypothetical protein